ncbi:hypothetical protein ACFWFF_30990, partial [Streptomyces sp. NPDC060223]
MGIRMLNRRTVIATAVVSALLAPIPAVAAHASTAQVPAACRSARDPDLAARRGRHHRGGEWYPQGPESVGVQHDYTRGH